jgi:hypothetical protein
MKSFGVAVTVIAPSGSEANGVTLLLAADAALVPVALVAVTVKV